MLAQDEAGSCREGILCEPCAAKGDDLEWRGGKLVARIAESGAGTQATSARGQIAQKIALFTVEGRLFALERLEYDVYGIDALGSSGMQELRLGFLQAYARRNLICVDGEPRHVVRVGNVRITARGAEMQIGTQGASVPHKTVLKRAGCSLLPRGLATVAPAVLAPYFAAIARRHREAPLIALVAAVPEGLDPVGWRAAVLSIHERCPEVVSHAAMKFKGAVRRDILANTTPEPCAVADAIAAYRRAIAPQGPRPPPERRRAPGLPCDDGRDE